MTSHEIARTLNMLIATCNDGVAGFQTAREAVADANLQHLFTSLSQQRETFAEDLQQLLELHSSDEPDDSTTLSGAVHRGWMNLRAAMMQGDDSAAILTECERGEAAAVHNYEKALEQNLPQTIRDVVASQHRCVVESLQQIRQLRDAVRAA